MLGFFQRASVVAALAGALCSACSGNSNGSGSGQCLNISGTWSISGTCGLQSCAVSQTGCATNFTCTGGAQSYSGTVSGNTFSYSGTVLGVAGTCSGTVSGTSLSGSCAGGGSQCTFSGTKQ